jgi:hypothetical protein
MRRLIFAGVPIAVLATTAAFAVAVANSDYNGAIKGDSYPGSSIGFDIKQAHHHRKVVNFVASGMAYDCTGGDYGDTTAADIEGSFRIHPDRSFGGKAHATILGTDPAAVLKGRLRHNGSAVGTLRLHGVLDPQGHPGVNCDTGTQDFKATKGPRVFVP